MKKIILILITFFIVFFPKDAFAASDPLSVPNNKVGIHILFTDEIGDAARLVNSNGGDWGYVTIPIQSGDRNLEKWQKFMDKAASDHVIPVLRLATEGDYFNTKVWRKPILSDITDFANFLDSLNWPTINRYVIVFNEPNRGDEWGGIPNPEEYAEILSFASSFFKFKNNNFFIISAGMDNAAANSSNSINEYDYIRGVNSYAPGIFNQIDGFGSHSYPNPGFSQEPSKVGYMSTSSFRSEKNLVKSFGAKDLPVFITETGWSREFVAEDVAARYFNSAFTSVWADSDIVTITPFLLKAGTLPFIHFSLFKEDGSKSLMYNAIEELSKIKGTPGLSSKILGEVTEKTNIPVKNFSKKYSETNERIFVSQNVISLLKWIMKI